MERRVERSMGGAEADAHLVVALLLDLQLASHMMHLVQIPLMVLHLHHFHQHHVQQLVTFNLRKPQQVKLLDSHGQVQLLLRDITQLKIQLVRSLVLQA